MLRGIELKIGSIRYPLLSTQLTLTGVIPGGRGSWEIRRIPTVGLPIASRLTSTRTTVFLAAKTERARTQYIYTYHSMSQQLTGKVLLLLEAFYGSRAVRVRIKRS